MDFGFRGGGSTITNPPNISLSQFCTMSTFHMAWALLTETIFKAFGSLFEIYYKIECLFVSFGEKMCKVLKVEIFFHACLLYASFKISGY
jgi:hypothetical protein